MSRRWIPGPNPMKLRTWLKLTCQPMGNLMNPWIHFIAQDISHSSPRGPSPPPSCTHLPSLSVQELHDGDNDDVHEPNEIANQNKRKRAAAYLLIETQEVELAEFYKENELFYNKKLKDYKNTDKNRLMGEQAATINPLCHACHRVRQQRCESPRALKCSQLPPSFLLGSWGFTMDLTSYSSKIPSNISGMVLLIVL